MVKHESDETKLVVLVVVLFHHDLHMQMVIILIQRKIRPGLDFDVRCKRVVVLVAHFCGEF